MKFRWNSILGLLLVILISACGNPNEDGSDSASNNIGGSTGATSNTASSTTESGSTIRLSLVGASDSLGTSTISRSNPGRLIATVTDDSGDPQSGALISFSSDFALFSPVSGTALTDSSGQANILLIPGEFAGAGAVSASFIVNDEETSTQLNFTVASSDATSSNVFTVTLTDVSNTPITAIRADLPGIITTTLVDENGVGIAGVVIKVEGSLAKFGPENGTVVTDSNGVATVQLLADDKTGADTLALTATTTGEILTALVVYQVNPPALQVGSTTAGTFTSDVLGINNAVLAASATTSVTLDVVDANGNAFTTPIEVEFTSNCVFAGTSSIDEKVTSINGQAVATYEAKGCQGNDLITATARYSGAVFSATGLVTVAADTAGFIEFISASPEFIAINGTGGAGLSEVSTVTFRARSKLGSPLSNLLINFSLNTSIGGITVTPSSKTTNAAGEVTTTVQSGKVSTSVRVTATVDSTNISTQSDQLIVSTGIADQDSISLSLSSQNPEAFSYDNETVTVTARLADRFNNPVPDGTAIYFTTEGGAVEPGCNTKDGACSVIWTSQEPRPIDHRVTILAVAVGDESFFDEDGNGSYNDNDGEPFFDTGNTFYDEPFDDASGNNDGILDEPFTNIGGGTAGYDFGETFVDHNRNGRHDGVGNVEAGESYTDTNGNGVYDGSGTIPSGDSYTEVIVNGVFDAPGFSDLPEAFLDVNENSTRDIGEPYLDFNNNGSYDIRDGQYNGILCTHTSICSSNRSVHVRKSVVLTMAGSNAYITVQNAASGEIYASNLPSITSFTALSVVLAPINLRINVTDSAGQVMPQGTGISIATDVGELIGQLDFTVRSGSNTGGHTLSATISDDDTSSNDSGFIVIEVTTPNQHITTLNIPLGV